MATEGSPVKRPKSKSAGKLGELVYFSRFSKREKGSMQKEKLGFLPPGAPPPPTHSRIFLSLPPPGGSPSGCYQKLADSSPRGPTRKGFGGWRGADPV